LPLTVDMRRIRRSFHLALTLAGTLVVLYAVTEVEAPLERMLYAALGLVLVQAGIWRITQSIFPNERGYKPLRQETDYFIQLVRRLNRAALRSERGVQGAGEDLDQIQREMHHSVDRMRRLAGVTEEDLGVRYRPGRTALPTRTS
jgi:hypothetical protein